MRRRENIRAAMQNLLSSNRHSDGEGQGATAVAAPEPLNLQVPADAAAVVTSGPPAVVAEPLPVMDFEGFTSVQKRTLMELQTLLKNNGIAAEHLEIVLAMVEALTYRPALCRSLLAAYLMEG